MTSSIKQLLALGPIPADSEMSDELSKIRQAAEFQPAPLLRRRGAAYRTVFPGLRRSELGDTQSDRGSLRHLRGAYVPRR